jgi:low temperature requirement protein LtrA
MHRLIRPWEYRRLRLVAGLRLSGGGFSVGLGAVLVALGRKAETNEDRRKCLRWAAWFLVSGALQLFGGVLDLTALRYATPSA